MHLPWLRYLLRDANLLATGAVKTVSVSAVGVDEDKVLVFELVVAPDWRIGDRGEDLLVKGTNCRPHSRSLRTCSRRPKWRQHRPNQQSAQFACSPPIPAQPPPRARSHIAKVKRDQVVLRTGSAPESLSDWAEYTIINAAHAVASAVSLRGRTLDATKHGATTADA
ncbi:hypothetical protein FRC12_016678 [Ceratobasidium sp. 428]|nr:hypothetical protein FRC12_016678 [Ceratobasidium sp. 428]